MTESRRILRQALALAALSVLAAAAVHFPLIKRFARGEFRESFFAQADYPGVRLITLGEAEDLWRAGEAAFIDARTADLYREGHVPRALSAPAPMIEKAFCTVGHSIRRYKATTPKKIMKAMKTPMSKPLPAIASRRKGLEGVDSLRERRN